MSQNMRLPKELYYLDIAETVSMRSTCMHKKWGAVIVKNDRIISTGYSGAPDALPQCIETGYCYRDENHIPEGIRYETCLWPNVKLMISNGRRATVADLYKHQTGTQYHIYAMNPTTKMVQQMPCTIMATRQVMDFYLITFDTGVHIRCTGDHKFMMADKETYVEAKDLKKLDKLAGMLWRNDPMLLPQCEMIKEYIATVSDIQHYDLKEPVLVYDVNVPEYHNFAIAIGDYGVNVGVFSHNCGAVHAEQNAIINASREEMLYATMYVFGWDAETGKMFDNMDSCTVCKRLIMNSGIEEVIYADKNGIMKHMHPEQRYGYRAVKVQSWIDNYDPDDLHID